MNYIQYFSPAILNSQSFLRCFQDKQINISFLIFSLTQRRKNRVDRESTLLANAAQDLPCCLCFVIIHELNAHARIYTFHHASLRNALKLPLSIPLILWRKSGSRVASICLPSLSLSLSSLPAYVFHTSISRIVPSCGNVDSRDSR